jgi:anti-sigma-K factor RskA
MIRLKCNDIEKLLADYTVGALDGDLAAQVEDHLRECESCRRELSALERVGELLQPMQMTEPPRDLWPRIRARLQPRRARRPVWQHYWRPGLALAAAAAILIAVIFALPLIQAPGTVAPTLELPVLADADSTTYAETQLAAAWDQPLADEASLALAMAFIEPADYSDDTIPATTEFDLQKEVIQ